MEIGVGVVWVWCGNELQTYGQTDWPTTVRKKREHKNKYMYSVMLVSILSTFETPLAGKFVLWLHTVVPYPLFSAWSDKLYHCELLHNCQPNQTPVHGCTFCLGNSFTRWQLSTAAVSIPSDPIFSLFHVFMMSFLLWSTWIIQFSKANEGKVVLFYYTVQCSWSFVKLPSALVDLSLASTLDVETLYSASPKYL